MSTSMLLQDGLVNSGRLLRNALRGWGRRAPDYVVIDLKGSFPERAPPRQPWWQRLLPFAQPALSIQELNEALDLIAHTPRVRGVILRIGSIAAPPARRQNLAAAISRFRRRGKRVVAYLENLTPPSYLVACAADEIVAPESASFTLTGIALSAPSLKDALATYGIEVEIEALGEYKMGPDPFRRSSMAEAGRDMLETILDSFFEDVVTDVANGRGLSPERVRQLIDDALFTAEQARNAGLIDALLYEDELATYLAAGNGNVGIEALPVARGRLRLPFRWRYPRVIGIVSLDGTILTGPSRRYPLPSIPLINPVAGSDTLSQALRRAERDKRVAAVVFFVDSPGGGELASDLIWHEVARLARKKPVVAYMGNLATSGGYYVSAPAQHIVAQSATQTGSIGVFHLKAVVTGLLNKAKVNYEYLSRGRHAMLWAPWLPWDDEGRGKIRADVEHSYALFKRRVGEGRGMAEEEVERVARGRLWTGKQALEQGLVDALGDFEIAVQKAKELSGLPLDRCVPVVPITAPRRFTLPQPFSEDAGPADWLPGGAGALLRGGVWAIMPWDLRLRW